MVDMDLLRLYPSADGMMHDECMVGMGGTAFKWARAVREVPDTAQLHSTVYERLAMTSVRNFTSFAPYRPVALQNHLKAKAHYEATTSRGDDTPASSPRGCAKFSGEWCYFDLIELQAGLRHRSWQRRSRGCVYLFFLVVFFAAFLVAAFGVFFAFFAFLAMSSSKKNRLSERAHAVHRQAQH